MSERPEIRGLLPVPERADEQEVQRILARSGDRSARDWLIHLPDPDTADWIRLERVVLAAARTPRRRLGIPLGGLGLVAAAAALLLALAWSGARGPAPLDLQVVATAPRSLALHQGISTVLQGRAHVTGLGSAPQVALEAGTLQVEVTPNMGFSYDVSTPEARVRVVGTRFQVARDPAGTHVTVARGTVEVTCTYGAPTLLHGAGASGDCPALSARDHRMAAHRLINSGAGVDAALAAVAAGLEVAADPEEQRALLELRVLLLNRARRGAEARAAACDYGARFPDRALPEGLDACQ